MRSSARAKSASGAFVRAQDCLSTKPPLLLAPRWPLRFGPQSTRLFGQGEGNCKSHDVVFELGFYLAFMLVNDGLSNGKSKAVSP